MLWKHINNCETGAVVWSTPEKPKRKLAILWEEPNPNSGQRVWLHQTLGNGIMNFFSFCDHVCPCILSEAGKNSVRSFN